MIRAATLGMALMMTYPLQVEAQAEVTDAMASFRRGAVPEEVAAILSQERSAVASAVLRSLEDSMVAVAVSYHPDQGSPTVALAAVAALHLAANEEHLAERVVRLQQRGIERRPVPFARSFEALERVFQGAQDAGLRGATMPLIVRSGSQARAIAFLREVITNPDPPDANAPSQAINLLLEMGEPGLRSLRTIHLTQEVPDPSAREYLARLATLHGWEA